ncbi:MAG: UDP-N-acetylmuramate dehydrogenase [Anaerotignaceae bacterium]
MALVDLLIEVTGKENVLLNENMSNHCSFKTGGNADYFITPENHMELAKVISILRDESVPVIVVGNGSNLLIRDKGIRGAVIHLGKHFADIEVKGTEIIVGAGAMLSQAAGMAMENSLTGFEFAAGIPGSFGGAVFMNAGAYGGEIKHVLKEVTVLTLDMQVKTLSAKKLQLGYRTSRVAVDGHIVLSGKINLNHGDKEEIKALMADFNERRRDKQPLNYPSAGSTFKRPEGYFAGKLIEDSGLKGYTVGGAMVSQKHAGFVVNTGDATTADILGVIEHCKEVIYKKYGIELQCEVRILGEE